MLIGIGLTVLLAFAGSTDHPPSASGQALIAFGAIVTQLAGAWAIGGEGKAEPTLAMRSVGRLVTMAGRSEEARDSRSG